MKLTKHFGFILVAIMSLILVSCGGSGSEAATSMNNLTSIQLSAPNGTIMPIGFTYKTTAVGHFADGSTRDITSQVTLNSSNPAIISIVEDQHQQHVPYATSSGNASISASYNGLRSNTLLLNTNEATLKAITLSANKASYPIGVNDSLISTGTFSDGNSYDISDDVIYNSSQPKVLELNKSKFKTISIGATSITANYSLPNNLLSSNKIAKTITSNKLDLIIHNATLKQIQIYADSTSIAKGTSTNIMAKGIFSNGEVYDITNVVNWNSSGNNTNITIEQNDNIIKVHGLTAGTGTISASSYGVTSNNLSINVTDAILTSIIITSENYNLAKGLNSQLFAKGVYSDHSTQDITSQVSWISSDNNIFTIDHNGKATANNIGSSDLTAELNGITSNKITIVVSSATLKQILINAPNSIPNGLALPITVTGIYTDGNRDITHSVQWLYDGKILSINNSTINALNVGTSRLQASLGGILSSSINITVTSAVLKNITINMANSGTSNLPIGKTMQINASGLYSDGSIIDITNDVLWISDNTNALPINENGFVNAKDLGDSSISAKLGDVTSNILHLRVTAAVAENVQISAEELTLPKGTTTKLHAEAFYSDGTTSDVTKEVTWITSKDNVIGINDNGTLIAYDANQVVDVYAQLGDLKSESLQFKVTDAALNAITVLNTPIQLPKGVESQLSAIGSYSDGTKKDITNDVAWVSSNDNVLSAKPNGVIHANQSGSAIISAKIGNISGSTTNINVSNAVIQSISIFPKDIRIQINNSIQLSAIATFTDASTLDVTNSVIWNTSNANLVISSTGILTGVDKGYSEIIAQLDLVTSDTISVSVSQPSWKYVAQPITLAGNLAYSTLPNIVLSRDDELYVSYQDNINSQKPGYGKIWVKKLIGEQWSDLNFAEPSNDSSAMPSMAISPTGTPYVAYVDGMNDQHVSVKKFENGKWFSLGKDGIVDLSCQRSSAALTISPDGTPYIICGGNSNTLKIFKFTNNLWQMVGNKLYDTNHTLVSPQIAIDGNSKIYIAYTVFDYVQGNEQRTAIKYFDGASWIDVGLISQAPQYIIRAYSMKFTLDRNGVPYVANATYGTKSITVGNYNQENDWAYVGPVQFSPKGAYEYKLAISKDNLPIIAYYIFADKNYWLSVQKFNGFTWEHLGDMNFAKVHTASNMATDIGLTVSAETGIPYVIFQDESKAGNLSVMKFE